MTTTDISQDAEDVDAAQGAAIAAEANEEAKQILARSRYEAFRLVTEARDEAETILDEARAEAAGTVKAATITAESKVDASEIRAKQIVEDAETRAESIKDAASRTSAKETKSTPPEERSLEAEHDELAERVGSLRVLADKLENRFAALAAGATVETESAPDKAADLPKIDYSPSVTPQAKADDGPAEESIDDRDSFYSRRSAKLPSIGAAGGQSAIDMTRSIRSKLESDS